MTDGPYADRIADLLGDAEAHAARRDWPGVRALAGAALALRPGSAEAARLLEVADASGEFDGERRQLTVMFCDVVGSTGLSEQHDPELVREVLRSYQVTCDQVVRRYEGTIARYIGDGILAYFGHPIAHEDDARRGVRAGLDLLDALRPVTEEMRRLYGVSLSIRVAVHTGLVVRAEMGSATTPDRDAIVGETPNLAARLQDHATPGTLVISDDTYALVRGWFLVVPKGEVDLRGIDRAVEAFEVIEALPTESRLQAQADLSPFIGRVEELDQIQEAWDDVRSGGTRTIVVTGPPGVGKTRLADVTRRRAEADEGSALVATCSSYHTTTALHPVRRLVERSAGIDPAHDPLQAGSRLWNALDDVGEGDALPYFADLLEIQGEAWIRPAELDGAKLREELLSTLVRWVSALASRMPLLLVVDDLQWSDPTTLEVVGRLISSRVPGLLLLLNAREGFTPPWSAPLHLSLDRLSAAELIDLAERLPEGRTLDRGHLDRAVERSDGIPLFLEELLRGEALAHGGATDDAIIPAALRDLLLARFAAPGVDLRVAQVLASIGGDISLDIVADVLRSSPDEVRDRVDPLIEAGILNAVGPGAVRFRHQLLADLAYETQLQAARRRTHGDIADALCKDAEEGTIDQAVLAHHLEQSGRVEEAVGALIQAAEIARDLAAYTEVSDILGHALELLEQADEESRAALEFEVRLLRGSTVASMMGFAAPDAVTDFQACRQLAWETPASDELGSATAERWAWSGTGLWTTFILTAQLDDAEAIRLGMLRQLTPGSDVHSYFDTARVWATYFRGDYKTAHPITSENVEILRRLELPRRLANPNDIEATTLTQLSILSVNSGHYSRARQELDQAVERARSLAFPIGPFSVCYATSQRAVLEDFMGCPDEAREFNRECAEVADRHGFPFWSLVASYQQGLDELRQGDMAAGGRAVMSMSVLRALGFLVWTPVFLTTLAEIYLGHGELDQADGYLQEAQDIAAQTGATYWSVETARVRAEVQLAKGDTAGGVAALREALALSEEQGSLLLELFTRTSICRNSEHPDDHKGLAAHIERFPEPDIHALVAARAVLRNLS